jgi:hypothetical protein
MLKSVDDETKRFWRPNFDSINSDILNDRGWLFHKEIINDLRPIFEQNPTTYWNRGSPTFTQKMIQGADKANSLMKGTLFGFFSSIYHGTALTMSQFATLPPGAAFRNTMDGIKFLSAKANPEKASEILLRMMSRSLRGPDGELLMAADDLIKEVGLSGLKIGKPQEAMEGYQAFEGMLRSIAENVPGKPLKSAFTGLAHLNSIFDQNLWLVMQNAFKTSTMLQIRNSEILRITRAGGKMPVGEQLFKINWEAAKITDQSFGGLAWEALGATPFFQKVARWAFLAPDWTLSNLLQARDLFVNIPGVKESVLGKAITRDVMLSDMRFRWAASYNLKAAFYGWTMSQLANYGFTHYKYGKGRWIGENGPEGIDPHTGLATRVELPYNRHNGRRQYMDVIKQFSEPIKLLHSPKEFFSSKMGALPRTFKTLVVGVDGFGRPIAGAEDGPYSEIVKTIGAATGQFMPISIRGLAEGATGKRDPRSAIINTIGFSVRTERKDRFELRQKIAEIQRQMADL